MSRVKRELEGRGKGGGSTGKKEDKWSWTICQCHDNNNDTLSKKDRDIVGGSIGWFQNFEFLLLRRQDWIYPGLMNESNLDVQSIFMSSVRMISSSTRNV